MLLMLMLRVYATPSVHADYAFDDFAQRAQHDRYGAAACRRRHFRHYAATPIRWI